MRRAPGGFRQSVDWQGAVVEPVPPLANGLQVMEVEDLTFEGAVGVPGAQRGQALAAKFSFQAGLDIAPFGSGRATLGEPALAGLVEKGGQALAEADVIQGPRPFFCRRGRGEAGTGREQGDLPLEDPSLALDQTLAVAWAQTLTLTLALTLLQVFLLTLGFSGTHFLISSFGRA